MLVGAEQGAFAFLSPLRFHRLRGLTCPTDPTESRTCNENQPCVNTIMYKKTALLNKYSYNPIRKYERMVRLGQLYGR
jgi:hypothetical protein